MNIHIAEHYGLCFGVRDAIAQAERLAEAGPLTILGELVHNPVVRERLTARGVQEGRLAQPGQAATARVMITAHGSSDTAQAAWREAGFTVADGTCPLVRHAHTQLRLLVEMGCHPIVIGQRGHVEVQGLMGDFPAAIVVEKESDAQDLPPAPRYGVVAQTTQPTDHVDALLRHLRACYPHREFLYRDTVCQPTKNRQMALRQLIATCDTLVIVGGRNSNNTRQLALTAEAAGRRVHHITRAEELQAAWFASALDVGVTAGTSTLKETVAAVVNRLESFAGLAQPQRDPLSKEVAA